MTHFQSMREDDIRSYLACMTLAHASGFDLEDDHVRNMVFIAGDLDTDTIVLYSDPQANKPGHVDKSFTTRLSVYLHDIIAEQTVAAHRLRVDAFFNLQYLRRSLGQGSNHNSLAFDVLHDGEVRHLLAGVEIGRDAETGHAMAAIAFMDASVFFDNEGAAMASNYDALTGVYTRIASSDYIHSYIFENVDGPAALAVVDIDSFHMINERYGYGFGDRVLMSLANDLRGIFGNRAHISRFNTDRFALFFPNMRPEEAEGLLRAFTSREREMIRRNNTDYAYTVSAGMSVYPDSAYNYDELVAQACEALRVAQSLGRGEFLSYNEEELANYQTNREVSVGELIENIPAAIFVYEAIGSERVVYANQRTVRLFDCEDLDDFMSYTGGTFKGIVHPDDYERISREIWSQIRGVTRDNKDFCRYRITTKKGVVKQVEDFGHLVETDMHSKLFYVVLHDEAQFN